MADLKIDKSRYTVDSLYQWDTNQELKIYGLSMVDPEIHFTNEAMGGSIVVDCTVDESGVISVKVPNSLLQYKYSIVAYIAGFEGDTFKTYHKVTIPVKARKRPGDYTLSLSDNEVYSFKSMSDRITNIEDEIKSEGSILYNYTYDNTNIKLVEASGKKSIGEYIPLVSNSLKAVKGLSDKFKTMIDANTKLGETALSIAKGINSAKVFDTTADMEAWLSDEANKGKCDVGNNLYIVDIDVPDWWIAEVLETPDSETGYYYKIAQLEVQKVDLTTINEDIDTLQSDVETLEELIPRVEALENRASGLAPYPVTNVKTEPLVFTEGIENATLKASWTKPVVYDIQVDHYNIYGYVGDTAPTNISEFTLVTTTKNTSIEIDVNKQYNYVLVTSVSVDGIEQENLSQRATVTVLNIPTKGITLADATWEQINSISKAGLASEYFSVGDAKTISIGGTNYNVLIYGFNHDDKSDGSGKAGITFGLANCLKTTYPMNTGSTNTNSKGWGSCSFRTTLRGTIYNQLPIELRNVIKNVSKKTSAGSQSSTINTSTDNLFLFSEIELCGTTNNTMAGEGSKYSIFTDSESRIKKLGDTGSTTNWWERSPYKSTSLSYGMINVYGNSDYNNSGAANSIGICFGFCV